MILNLARTRVELANDDFALMNQGAAPAKLAAHLHPSHRAANRRALSADARADFAAQCGLLLERKPHAADQIVLHLIDRRRAYRRRAASAGLQIARSMTQRSSVIRPSIPQRSLGWPANSRR
jgi:hypothetical protein